MAFDTQAVLGGSHSDLHHYHKLKSQKMGTSLLAHWLRLCPPSAGCTGSIPGQGIKISHVMWCGQKKKVKMVKHFNLPLTPVRPNIHIRWPMQLPLSYC